MIFPNFGRTFWIGTMKRVNKEQGKNVLSTSISEDFIPVF